MSRAVGTKDNPFFGTIETESDFWSVWQKVPNPIKFAYICFA